MIIHTMPQRSEEWFAVRCGKFTASDFGVLMPSSKQSMADFNKTQMAIIYRVAAERMTGIPVADGYVSKAMQHGIDTEDEARISYMLETGKEVKQVGFVEYDEWIGCSPDGLVGDDAGLEIKCPNSDTHLRYFSDHGELTADYYWQCMGGMLCTDRLWWDLYSYDPRFKNEAQKSVLVSIRRDNDEIRNMRERLDHAIEKVKAICET